MIVPQLRRCPFCGNEAEIVPCDPPERDNSNSTC